MKISCNLTIEYESEKMAKTILRAVQVDDVDFVSSKISGTQLTATIKSSSVSSLLHTLDDYLACISVAEKVANKR